MHYSGCNGKKQYNLTSCCECNIKRIKKKLAIIGAGNIGGLAAYIAGCKGFAEVVLVDLNSDMTKAKASDLTHCSVMNRWGTKFLGTSDYSDIIGSEVVIVTAGMARKHGMTRTDLLMVNAVVIADIAKNIQQFAPHAFVVVVTNPLDAMTSFFQRCSNFAHNMVVGMAGELDNSRFRAFLAEELNIAAAGITSFVIGDHGEFMFPVLSNTTVHGVPLLQMVEAGIIKMEQIEHVVKRMKNAGAEIVELLKTSSAYHAPAAISMEMVDSYVSNQKRIFCATAYLSGEYGENDIYAGVPVVIGEGGVENVVEIKLHDQELHKFTTAAREIRELVKSLK